MKRVESIAERQRVVPRAVTLEILNPTRRELDPLMAPAFDLSTRLSNWATQTLFNRDVQGARECPRAVKPRGKTNPEGCYLYGLAGERFPGWVALSDEVAQSAATILQKVHGKYLTDRYDFMCEYDSALLSYRYPQPFPIHNARWKLEFRPHSPKVGVAVARPDQSENLEPIFTANLPGRAGVEFRLRSGRQFYRQTEMLKQILNGDELLRSGRVEKAEPDPVVLRHFNAAIRGEAAITREGRGKDATYYLKIVGRFPARHRSERERERCCLLTTQPHALLCAEIDGRKTTVTNCDALKRAVAVVRTENERHRRYLQRVSEDMKYAVRRSKRQRRTYKRNVAERCEHARKSIDTAIGHIVSQTADFLDRQRVGCVVYDDSKRQFIEDVKIDDASLSFPWFDLANQLKDKLFELGMVCVFPLTTSAKDEQREEYLRWLENPSGLWATSLAVKRAAAHRARGDRSDPAVSTPSATC